MAQQSESARAATAQVTLAVDQVAQVVQQLIAGFRLKDSKSGGPVGLPLGKKNQADDEKMIYMTKNQLFFREVPSWKTGTRPNPTWRQ